MDRFRIDGHKLHHHLPRVSDWLSGQNIYPIYMEASPAGACNHRCTFCGVDFMGYQKRRLDAERFLERLVELGELGLKSVMYAGEGEPLLHPELGRFLEHGKRAGIDGAITTNGVLLGQRQAEQILPHTEWVKVSINAGSADTYAAVHRTKAGDFERVFENLERAVRLREELAASCTLGMQLVLLPENQHEVLGLARRARDIGMDYLVIKPYSQHLQSLTLRYQQHRYDAEVERLAEQLAALGTERFSCVVRLGAVRRSQETERPYRSCLALPFWSYVDAGGGVWGCSVYLGDQRFYYGNIYEESFRDIWEGQRRRESLAWVERELDTRGCRVNCRMDPINRYLWDLKHPPAHLNFI